jgi:hypothetical protein
VANELDQAARREPIVGKDQYGRKWESTWDTVGKGTCAPINPRGWVDPLNTPQKYIKAIRDEDGMRSFFVDLERWEMDLENAHREYDQKLYNDAVMLFGERGPDAYTERAPALMHFTGQSPQPIELVQAAIDGNSWALGKTLTPDPRLVKYFASTAKKRPSFADTDEATALQDEIDPKGTGGKRVPLRTRQRVEA